MEDVGSMGNSLVNIKSQKLDLSLLEKEIHYLILEEVNVTQ